MRTFHFSAMLAVAALLSGCTQVGSLRPLYTEEEPNTPPREPRLEGEWGMANLSPDEEHGELPQSPIHVSIGTGNTFGGPEYVTFRWKDNPSDEKETCYLYEVQLVPIGDSLFFDAVLSEKEEKGTKQTKGQFSEMGGVTVHQLGQLWITPQFVRFAPLNEEWVTEHWPAAEAYDYVSPQHQRSITLTNQTADLRQLLVKAAPDFKAFAPMIYLCRAGVDCTKLEVEDELERAPDDEGVLVQGVAFYAKRGDYPKAIALQRHLIQTNKPENKTPDSRQIYQLGKLLLLNREFASARDAWRAVKAEPGYGDPTSAEMIVRSYFLQGDYAATVQAAKSVKSPNSMTAADSIILAYFALGRMGKAKEAESFLGEQTLAFRGNIQEEAFLLKAGGRLTPNEWQKDIDRDVYYSALRAIQTGDVRQATTLLRRQVGMSVKDNLLALASQIELERLSQPAGK